MALKRLKASERGSPRFARAQPLCAVALAALLIVGAVPAQESALSRLTATLSQELLRQKPEAPVALHVRGASPELGRALATLLAAQLSHAQLAPMLLDAPSADLAESAARTAGARSLLRLSVSIEQGALTARGDLLGTWVNFWSGAARTRPPSPAAALSANTEADAQALALAAAPAPTVTGELKLALSPFARLSAPPAALAAGDLDGDGRDEVVVLTDDEVLALTPAGAALARRDLRGLLLSPTPCREPFGALAVLSKPARVAYASGRRARGELLAFDKSGLRPAALTDDAVLARHKDAQITGRLLPGRTLFAQEVTLTGGPAQTVPAPFTAASLFRAAEGVELLFVYPDGGGRWTRAGGALSLTGLGSGSALVDLDGDGRAELATTSPHFFPAPEQLRILQDAEGAPRWEGDVPRGRVLQLTSADLDGDGKQELILGSWLPDGSGELWVARRVAP